MFPRLGSSGPGASWRHSAVLARRVSAECPRPRTPSLLMPASPSPLTGRVKCRAHVRAAIHATHAHVRMCVGMTGDYTYAVSSLQVCAPPHRSVGHARRVCPECVRGGPVRKGSSLMSLDPCSPGNPSLPGATEVPGREDDLWAAVRKAAADARETHTSRDSGTAG